MIITVGMQTYKTLSDLRLDVAHLARYSPREGTVSSPRLGRRL